MRWQKILGVSEPPHWLLADNKFVREGGSLLAGEAEQD